MSRDISIVIPSWNGLHLLRENLPSVLEAGRCYSAETGARVECLVVDDGSEDQTRRWLPQEFPEVHLVLRAQNGGFAVACNSGFEKTRFPLVALLNNDVRVQEDYLLHQAGHFDRPDVFAVTAKVYEWDSSLFTTGGRFGRFRRGFWSVYFNYDVSLERAAEWVTESRLLSIYAIGGFATYDRQKLMALNGFNPLMTPFHWEDVDLSYRAWKRGWEVHYEPRGLAYHRTSATINAHYRAPVVEAISFRNRLLFHWINLHSKRFLFYHLFSLLVMVLTKFLVLDYRFYGSLAAAMARLPSVLPLRRREARESRRSDLEVSRLLKDFYSSAPIDVYYDQSQVKARHPDYLETRNGQTQALHTRSNEKD